MTPAEIIALAQAAATVLNMVASLRATADAATQAQVDAILAGAETKFSVDAATAEADLAQAN